MYHEQKSNFSMHLHTVVLLELTKTIKKFLLIEITLK